MSRHYTPFCPPRRSKSPRLRVGTPPAPTAARLRPRRPPASAPPSCVRATLLHPHRSPASAPPSTTPQLAPHSPRPRLWAPDSSVQTPRALTGNAPTLPCLPPRPGMSPGIRPACCPGSPLIAQAQAQDRVLGPDAMPPTQPVTPAYPPTTTWGDQPTKITLSCKMRYKSRFIGG